jgi:peptide/nickel transport system permease protein
MGRQIIHRLIISFPAVLGVLFLCFCLLQVVPADPAAVIAGPDAKAETIAAIRLQLGLDRPIIVQFGEYIMRILQGDLGRSIISNKRVIEELANTIGPTIELMVGGMLIAIPCGMALGTLAAVKRGTLTDRAIMAFAVAGFSIPVFVVGYLLSYFFALYLEWLPTQGYTPIREGLWPWLENLILPTIALGFVYIALIARITRATMLEVLSQDYVRTAKAKGVGQFSVLFLHALKNAAVPIQGIVLMFSFVYVIVNLCVDLTYTALDPRIRY